MLGKKKKDEQIKKKGFTIKNFKNNNHRKTKSKKYG